MARVNWKHEVAAPEPEEIPEGITLISTEPHIIFEGKVQDVLRFTRDYLMLASLNEARSYLM